MRKRVNSHMESEYLVLKVDLYSRNKRHSMRYVLGSVYSLRRQQVGSYIVKYTPNFMMFIQQIIYITAMQGPYSEMFHSAMESMKTDNNYVVYDPIE